MLRARLALLAAVAIWGSTFVATKVCLEYLHPLALVGLRFGLGLPVLAGLLYGRRTPLRLERRDAAPLLAGAAVFLFHFLIQAWALTATTATNSSWIIAVTPLVIAVAAAVFLRETLGPATIFGVIVATLGVLLLVSHGRLSPVGGLLNPGDWLMLLSAHTWALYTVVTRDLSRRRDPLLVTLLLVLPVSLVSLVLGGLASPPRLWFSLPGDALGALLFLGILGTVANWFWQNGVARLGAAKAGIFLYLEPLVTTALAVPLLAEPFGWSTALGGALVLAGVAWAGRSAR